MFKELKEVNAALDSVDDFSLQQAKYRSTGELNIKPEVWLIIRAALALVKIFCWGKRREKIIQVIAFIESLLPK